MHRLVNGATEKFEDVNNAAFKDLIAQTQYRWTFVGSEGSRSIADSRVVMIFDNGNASGATNAIAARSRLSSL
jgi:hypothetical protein